MRLIDADDLRQVLEVYSEKDSLGHTPVQLCDAMPTIEERKTGRWIEREVMDEKWIEEWQSARCSVCGRYHTTPYMYYFDEYHFCPNCGADMREEHSTDNNL